MTPSAVFPELELDRSRQAPSLRRQIARQLADAIRRGTLPGGSRLPSSRCMARWLGVSRGTVADAYDALLADGMLLAHAGRCVSVAGVSPAVPTRGALRRMAAAAHYPARVCRFEDTDGTLLYLNVAQEIARA